MADVLYATGSVDEFSYVGPGTNTDLTMDNSIPDEGMPDAVVVLSMALYANSAAIFSTPTITIGDVSATIISLDGTAGFGDGQPHLLVAMARMPNEGFATNIIHINWPGIAVIEPTVLARAEVFYNVAISSDGFALGYVTANETTGTLALPNGVPAGGAVFGASIQYTGGDFAAEFDSGSNETPFDPSLYTLSSDASLSDGHYYVTGYRLFNNLEAEELLISPDEQEFRPVIAFVLAGTESTSDPESDNFNCSCEDETGYKTLAELRADIIRRLGFVEQKAVIAGKTLGTFKSYLMARLGFAAQIANPPPGMPELLTILVNEAQDTLWRRYSYDIQGGAAPPALVADANACTLDSMAVQLLALANAKAHYGQADAKSFYDQFETYLKELLQRSPLNLTATVNSFLQDAQQQLYRNYAALRTERFYRWTMTAGERFYDLPDNDDECAKELDAYKVTWVGIEDLNGTWYPLTEGINPTLYTSVNSRGLPARYEIRQCIEVFPAPVAAYTLRVKGHFGLSSFTADTDQTTIDDHAVFLLALAQAKSHFQQVDAQNYFSQVATHVGSLVAGGHHTARYVPGAGRGAAIPRPRFLPLEE